MNHEQIMRWLWIVGFYSALWLALYAFNLWLLGDRRITMAFWLACVFAVGHVLVTYPRLKEVRL